MNSAAFSDYSRAKAMREVKALKLLQLFESNKLIHIIEDNLETENTWDGHIPVINKICFTKDIEDYLKDTD